MNIDPVIILFLVLLAIGLSLGYVGEKSLENLKGKSSKSTSHKIRK